MNAVPHPRPLEHELRHLQQTLANLEAWAQFAAVDNDGSLRELDAVLRLKRGCRR